MKKVMKTLNKALSVILIAAMVITLTPETAYQVNAAETDQTEMESTESVVSTEAVVDEIIEETDVKEASGAVNVIFTPTYDQVTVVGETTTTAGSDYLFTVTQVTGYEVTDVSVSGGATGFKSVPESGKYGTYVVDNTGTVLAQDITITITTAAVYDVTFNLNDKADISVNGTVLTDTTKTISYITGSEVHFTVTPKEGYEITAVQYLPSGGSRTSAYFDEDDNTYFFTLSNATTVDVTVTQTAAAKAVFTGRLGKVTITKRNGTALTTAVDLSDFEEDVNLVKTFTDTLASQKGTELSFKLEADDTYRIVEVLYNKKIVTPDANGVYTVTAGETTEITVNTERIPESFKYKLTFDLGPGVSSPNVIQAGDTYQVLEGNNVIGTDSSTVYFTVNLNEGYELDQVTAGTSGGTLEKDEQNSGYYTYTFAASEDDSQVSATISVTAKAKTATGERTFYFNNVNGVTTPVVTTAGVTYDSSTGYYTIPYQAASDNAAAVTIDEVEFTFTAPALNEYQELYTNTNAVKLVKVKETTEKGITTYTYKFSTAELSETVEDNWIDIRINTELAEIIFTGGTPEKIKASDWDGSYEPPESDNNFQRMFDFGETVIVTLRDNMAAYLVKDGVTSDTPVAVDANNKFSFVVTEDVTYELKYINNYKITTDPLDLSEAVLAGKEITASVSRFDNGEAASPYKVAVNDDAASTAVIKDGKVTITAAKEDAGKEVSVELFVREANDGKYKTVSAGTVTFTVEKTITSVKYTKKSISQTADTTASYSLSVAPASISANALAVEISKELSDTGVKAEITKETTSGKSAFKLNVTTGINEAKGNILIYDATMAEGDRTASNALCTIPVSVVKADLTVFSVKASKMTHYSAILSVKSKNKLNTEGNKPYYYEVKVTPATGTGAPTREEVTTYNYFRYETQTQTIEVQLSDRAGSAVAWDYDIEVKLVQPSETVVNGSTALGNTNASASAKTLSVKTKAPYYEDKLSVTKKTTTIYSGQSDVVAAVAKFSKNATYLENATAAVYYTDGTIYSGSDKYAINAKVGDNGEILVSVGEYVTVGSYTIKVVPDAEEGMYAAPATFKIKVVAGINRITITGPAKVYKSQKKAVTIKLSYGFYRKINGYYSSAKTKKATYALYADENCTEELTGDLAKYVTVNKSGKITIAKGYQATADEEDNTFYLKATAADYNGNTTYNTKEIVITSDEVTLGSVYIEKYNSSTYQFEKVTEVTTYDLYKGYVRVSALDTDGYTVDSDFLTYKSNNKVVSAFSYSRNLGLGQYKTAKNVTITATTGNGSKKSTKLSVVYAEPESLDLTCTSAYDYGKGSIDVTAGKDNTFTYSSSGNVLLYCDVKENGSKSLYNVGLCNYKVSVKGGKVRYSDSYSGYWDIQPTAEVTTVTLTDKSKNPEATKTYTFTNTGYVTTKAPTAKLYGIGGTPGKTKVYGGDTAVLTYVVNSNKYTHVCINGSLVSEIEAVGTTKGSFFFPYLPPYVGTNILYMTYGHLDDNKNFVADTKTSTVKLKVSKLPTPKLVSTYTMTKTAGSTVTLQIKNGQLNTKTLDFKDAVLLNANVKGQPNKFTDYFVLDTEKGTITLKDMTEDDIAKITKTDMTGYITHTVYNNVTVTEKITIKFSSK